MVLHVVPPLAAWWVTGDWLAGCSVVVLLLCFHLLRVRVGPPVLFLAMSYQWIQVSLGLFYGPLFGRTLEAYATDDYRAMVLIGLGCILSLSAGIYAAGRYIGQPAATEPDAPVLRDWTLVAVYASALLLVAGVQAVAWMYPAIRQALVALTSVHLILFYMLVRRYVVPVVKPAPVAILLAVEIAVGLTGFFASFREPIVLVAIAFLEVYDWRRLSHTVSLIGLGVAALVLATFWIGVRTPYRQDLLNEETFSESRSGRLERLSQLGHDWANQDPDDRFANLDLLVDRMWAVYYPGLAVGRVPTVLPHTDGALTSAALQHIFAPRILFPDKPALPSDSELVRKYSGLWVAGEEQDTTIAFGYAGELYVDFGVPVMFVPLLIWGVFVGAAYQLCVTRIHHSDIAVPLVAVVFWMSLYLFERSLAKMMGSTGTLLLYVAGPAYLIDRYLVTLRAQRTVTRDEDSFSVGSPAC